MRLRGTLFSPVVSVTRPLTLRGDNAKRAYSRVRYGAGVVLSDGRAERMPLSDFLRSRTLERETRPFFIRLRMTEGDQEACLKEVLACISLIEDARQSIPVTFGVALEVPLSMAPDAAADMAQTPGIDAVIVSDMVAWDALPERVRKIFFGRTDSPLASIGGGMVSGKYLLPLTLEWMRQARRSFLQKPIIASGMLRMRDVDALKEAGASAVFLGVLPKLRPWNIGRITRRAEAVFRNS